MTCLCGCGKETPIATQNHAKRGWVKGQPMRFCWGHRISSTPQELFEKHVVKNAEGCWGWNGAKHGFGYGLVRYRRKTIRAHRISWEIANGPIPKGIHVLHHCDNPPCSNPSHLFLGTNRDNMLDKVRKGRQYRPLAAHTALQPIRKLNIDQVMTIKSIRASGESLRSIAREFSVSPSNIGKIVHGITWRQA